MESRRLSVDRLLEQPSGRSRLLVLPFVLIAVITVTDLLLPETVHLGPLLVIAPALTASLAGPRLTAVAGVLAVAAQTLIGVFEGGIGTANHVAEIIALTGLSLLVFLVCVARDRRNRELGRARSVAETTQRVLLRPPPRRVGPQQVAWLYLSAEDETQIGGDLFATARAAHPATRVIIGDVRGHGLASIGEASMVLGAFREAAHRHAGLPDLVAAVEESVSRNLEEVADVVEDIGEHFVTALLLDLPDDGSRAEMINCGHPPPLLIHDRQVTALYAHRISPPLGVTAPHPAAVLRTEQFAFEPGDFLVLYTDGFIEARSPAGEFYPLAERVAGLPATDPDVLLDHIHHDLLRHTGGQPADDAALLILQRTAKQQEPGRHADRWPGTDPGHRRAA
ncbi:serine/threonine-protein phosphatase [Streptomyces sp. NBC_00669]|uniref:PP2C family protein-serine/threonine phosphatase n=1 Tax=Streptomyces sp. NBC_00669 TaxID=2976011 RepID=UPI002E32DAAA|nr:PP2C family protein-serine/threonine phosphatase [Streptomyces sp. NBC_00669]